MKLTRPKLADWRIIGLYTGKIIVGVGFLLLVPLVTGIGFREWSAVLDFTIGAAAAFGFGYGLQTICLTNREMTWMHGLVTTAFSWLIAMIIGAIPPYLSGHYGSFVDACFDLMSQYTTTGLFLLQDLDHISNALNMWRHVGTYVGGQGIIVVALTFLIRGTSGAFMMYVGEGKDEKLLPNVIQTARAIWLVSLTYMVLGTVALTIANLADGLSWGRAPLQALWVFMGAWSTGGFAPQSYNILYYHSFSVELLTLIIMIIGSLNFALHWAVWTGNRREIYRNIEIIAFSVTLLLTVALAAYALAQVDAYQGLAAMFRKTIYQMASAHTTTGTMTIYARQFVTQWGPTAMLAAIIAMSIGGSAASTAGGFKGMRVGIIFKNFVSEIRRLMLPESAVRLTKIHHVKDRYMTDEQVQAALTIVFSYIVIYFLGAVLGVLNGFPLVESLFESVSAGSNTGLSCGVTSPGMPMVLKSYFIFVMWIGRLEFIAVLALAGFVFRVARGR